MADKYGADATRLSLVIGASAGNDIKLSEDRVRGYRNFSTKIWNIARFMQMNKPEKYESRATDISAREEIKELDALKTEVTKHIEDFEFHLAGEKLYHYIWHTPGGQNRRGRKEKIERWHAMPKKRNPMPYSNISFWLPSQCCIHSCRSSPRRSIRSSAPGRY